MLRQITNLRSFGRAIHVPKRNVYVRTCSFESIQSPTYADLPLDQQKQIDVYIDTLLDWNQRMNLTAITDRDEVYTRHVNDSLSLLPILDECISQLPTSLQSSISPATPVTLCDVGSGAGLPGSILAISRPDWHVTLLDSLQKRCTFNKTAATAAGLKNISIEWSRAEDAGRHPLLRDSNMLVVARAVAELRILAELCLPLVAVGGFWIAAKGAHPHDEVHLAMNSIKELGGTLISVVEVDSIAPEGRRTVVVVRKEKPTSSKYPRKPGTPKKQPL